MLFALSDVVWQSIIAAVLAVIMAYLQKWNAAGQKQIKEVIAEVKEDTKKTVKKVDKQGETIDVIHHLSNGVLGKTLASNKYLARWKADQKGATAEDIAVADEAEKQFREHQANEAKALEMKKAKPMEVVVVQPDDSPVPVQEAK